ncbi:hypothetical protein ACIPVA_37695 [Streptomyces anulatus]
MFVSVAAIARRAGVDRTFLYRHRDLLGQIHVQAAEPPTVPGGRGPAVSRASLQADLMAADARTARLAAQLRCLEGRLSEVLGEQVWRESGIGGPDGTEQLQARITTLEQQVVDLELKLHDRDDDLASARRGRRRGRRRPRRRPRRQPRAHGPAQSPGLGTGIDATAEPASEGVPAGTVPAGYRRNRQIRRT